MKNAEWIIKTGHTFKQLRLIQHNELANRSYTVMLCDEPIAELSDKKEPLDVFRKWLDAEHKEPILDDTERAYLSAVIKPFRDRVVCLEKYKGELNFGAKYERIEGQVRSEWDKNLIFGFYLSPFRTETMYKGMEVGREYTIEELGL